MANLNDLNITDDLSPLVHRSTRRRSPSITVISHRKPGEDYITETAAWQARWDAARKLYDDFPFKVDDRSFDDLSVKAQNMWLKMAKSAITAYNASLKRKL